MSYVSKCFKCVCLSLRVNSASKREWQNKIRKLIILIEKLVCEDIEVNSSIHVTSTKLSWHVCKCIIICKVYKPVELDRVVSNKRCNSYELSFREVHIRLFISTIFNFWIEKCRHDPLAQHNGHRSHMSILNQSEIAWHDRWTNSIVLKTSRKTVDNESKLFIQVKTHSNESNPIPTRPIPMLPQPNLYQVFLCTHHILHRSHHYHNHLRVHLSRCNFRRFTSRFRQSPISRLTIDF